MEMSLRINFFVKVKPPPLGMLGFSISRHLRQAAASSTRALMREGSGMAMNVWMRLG